MQLVWIVCSYLLGAIPFGLIFGKYFCQIDPRTAGSQNVGSTNVARLCGKKWGIITLVCDILKGVFPVSIAIASNHGATFVTLTALAAVLGHIFSCFTGFKGGKAVATSIGVFIPIAIGPLLVSVVFCLFAIWYSGFVSLGSIILVLTLPICLAFAGIWKMIPLALAIAALVIWKHQANIQRLRSKTEKSWKKSEYKE